MTALGNRLMAKIGREFDGTPTIISPKLVSPTSEPRRDSELGHFYDVNKQAQPMKRRELRDIRARAKRPIRNEAEAQEFLRQERETGMKEELFGRLHKK